MQFGPQYLRTFHVVTSTAERRRVFQDENRCELLLQVFNFNREKQRLALHAYVIMPDHVHLLLTPPPEVSLEKAVQFIKGGFSFRLKSKLSPWATSFHDTRIADRVQFDNCVQYIHDNPVRARLALTTGEFRYSSAHESASVDAMPNGSQENPGAKAQFLQALFAGLKPGAPTRPKARRSHKT
jgi:putative transposase